MFQVILKYIMFVDLCCSMSVEDGSTVGLCSGACCTDYFMKNGICYPCENGTYGLNCTEECPPFYYGQKCLSPCNCPESIDCDPRDGSCKLRPSGDQSRCNKEDEEVNFPLWSIGYIVLGVIIIVLVSVTIFYRRAICISNSGRNSIRLSERRPCNTENSKGEQGSTYTKMRRLSGPNEINTCIEQTQKLTAYPRNAENSLMIGSDHLSQDFSESIVPQHSSQTPMTSDNKGDKYRMVKSY